MKNLKKILSLVLALAMALSLMTAAFAADASDYKDYSKVTYNEAVDVMTAAGIFQGNNGNFDPNGTLTREQAAKIIAYMLVGQEKADKLTATIAPYSDVSANRWSAGAIAYCKNEGIIAGTGNGKFSPTAELTGLQFAKMLLVALGYDATIEKLEGASWAINTSKLALGDPDLDNGMENVSLSKVLTREEAAQMAFNTMKATLVEYDDKGDNITVGGITINTGASKATFVTSKVKANATSICADKTTDGLYTVEFGEKYCDKLVAKGTNDDFMRPATQWKYDGNNVGTYADDADETITIGSAKDLKTVMTDGDYLNLDSADIKANATVYMNGFEVGTYDNLKTAKLGIGDTIEAYENDDNDVTRIIVIRYLAAQIDEVDNDLSSSYTKQNASYSITFKAVDNGNVPAGTYYDKYKNNSDKELPGFDAAAYTEDAVVALAVKATNVEVTKVGQNNVITPTFGNVILDSYVAEKLTGAISTYSAKDEYVYVDNTKYKFAAIFDGAKNNYDKGTNYDVYTTKEGYALAIVGADDATLDDVYYVVGVYKSSTSYDSNATYAQVVNVTTGEKKDLQLEKTEQATVIATAQTNALKDGAKGIQPVKGLYTFEDKKTGTSKANNDKFNASLYQGDSDFSYSIATANGQVKPLVSDIKKDTTSVKLNSRANGKTYVNKTEATTFVDKKYITSTTNFLTIEDKGSDLDVTKAVGLQKCSAQDADTVIVVYEKNSNKASYVLYAGDSFDSSIGTDDVIYLNGNGSFNLNNDKDTVATDKAVYFMDSKDSKDVVLSGNKVNSTFYADAQGFYSYSTDKDDIYALTEITNISKKVADGVDGYMANLQVTSYEDASNILSDGNYFDDVSYANATVIDTRGSDADDDVYTGTINSVAALNKALDKVDNYEGWNTTAKKGIVLDVCVEDGDITFIAVRSIMDADKAEEKGPTVDPTIKSVTLDQNGKFTVTLTANVTKETPYTYTVEKYMENTDKFMTIATDTVKVAANSASKEVTLTNVNAGSIYRVTVGGVSSSTVAIATPVQSAP